MGQSYFQKRQATKALAKIHETEQASGRELSHVAAQGTQKMKWNDTATVVVCVFAVIFFVALLAGYFVLPGGILLGIGYNAVKPRRTISVSDNTVTLWSHGMLAGGVKEVVANDNRASTVFGEWTSVAGHPPVKLSHDEVSALISAPRSAAPMTSPHVPPAPTGPNPMQTETSFYRQ